MKTVHQKCSWFTSKRHSKSALSHAIVRVRSLQDSSKDWDTYLPNLLFYSSVKSIEVIQLRVICLSSLYIAVGPIQELIVPLSCAYASNCLAEAQGSKRGSVKGSELRVVS